MKKETGKILNKDESINKEPAELSEKELAPVTGGGMDVIHNNEAHNTLTQLPRKHEGGLSKSLSKLSSG